MMTLKKDPKMKRGEKFSCCCLLEKVPVFGGDWGNVSFRAGFGDGKAGVVFSPLTSWEKESPSENGHQRKWRTGGTTSCEISEQRG